MAELEKKQEIFSDDPEMNEFCNDLLNGVREMKAGIAARCNRVEVPSVDDTGICSKPPVVNSQMQSRASEPMEIPHPRMQPDRAGRHDGEPQKSRTRKGHQA